LSIEERYSGDENYIAVVGALADKRAAERLLLCGDAQRGVDLAMKNRL